MWDKFEIVTLYYNQVSKTNSRKIHLWTNGQQTSFVHRKVAREKKNDILIKVLYRNVQ